jgi:hypothetical protein
MQKDGNYQIEEYIRKTIGLDFKNEGSVGDVVKGLPELEELVSS